MPNTNTEFKYKAREALKDEQLQQALVGVKQGLVNNRLDAIKVVPEFESFRNDAAAVKQHVLENLDLYLEEFEENAISSGAIVHWAKTAEDARQIILDICKQNNAKNIIKGKSMVSEEIRLNEALKNNGLDVVETDLGEYIVQLADEPPSHIIMPCIHKTLSQITQLFRKNHTDIHKADKNYSVADIVNEAREVMRRKFLSADIGIIGANFLIAETGSIVLVTNEGNGDLCSCLPKTQIITTSIEKVLPTLDDASLLLKVLARSATGQQITSYNTLLTGPKQDNDKDGPEEMHIVLVDNGRSKMLKTELREMLRCIRCGACLNHCPVYGSVGGHAYNSVYPGPMGSILSPAIEGLEKYYDLPNACTLNGRCESVCPVKIPLTKILRHLRNEQFKKRLNNKSTRFSLKLWSFFATRPKLYHRFNSLFINALNIYINILNRYSAIPVFSSWLKSRDFAPSQQKTFQQIWQSRKEND